MKGQWVHLRFMSSKNSQKICILHQRLYFARLFQNSNLCNNICKRIIVYTIQARTGNFCQGANFPALCVPKFAPLPKRGNYCSRKGYIFGWGQMYGQRGGGIFLAKLGHIFCHDEDVSWPYYRLNLEKKNFLWLVGKLCQTLAPTSGEGNFFSKGGQKWFTPANRPRLLICTFTLPNKTYLPLSI